MAQLTNDEILLKCADDPVFFAKMVLPAAPSPKFKVGAPLELKWWQEEGLEELKTNRRVTLRIRRQTGKTIFLVVYALWALIFEGSKRHLEVLVVAPQQHHVNTWYERFCHFIDNCPFLKSMIVERKKTPNLFIRFENGSFINLIPGGPEGTSVRSKTADILFIDEADYLTPGAETAIAGLIKTHTQVIATTTIRGNKTMFYRWCNVDKGWLNLHIDSETDPDFSPEEEAELRASGLTRQAYDREVRCVWTDADATVYPLNLLDRAAAYDEWEYEDYINPSMSLPTSGPCFMGVDWDKYGAGSTLLVLQEDMGENSPTHGMLRVVYREEIPRTDHSLMKAVERVIWLNDYFSPNRINCDRGYGEHQVETLQAHGLAHPETHLHERVVGIASQSRIELVDPVTGAGMKKPLKAYMVARSQYLLEQDKFAFTRADTLLLEQLAEYEVIDAEKEVYTHKNDHCVDALNLAVLAYVQYSGEYERDTEASLVLTGQMPKPPDPAPMIAPLVFTGSRTPWISRGQETFSGRRNQGRAGYLRRI